MYHPSIQYTEISLSKLYLVDIKSLDHCKNNAQLPSNVALNKPLGESPSELR